MLGKKQRISNDEWIEAVKNIRDTVKKKDLDIKVKATVKNIKEKTAGKKAAYCWSAGKDSLVLGKLCEKAGIKDCVLVVSDLEYPAFSTWVEEHKPEGLTIINTHQNLDWLSKHQQMLFPQDSKAAAQWFHIVQHRGQAEYFKDKDLDMLILGRRRADGNYVGKGTNIYTNRQGVTRFSPLADWTHEDILAYIDYYDVAMPPIYGWKNGYLCGTHPWPARQWTESIENGWKEIWDIDHSIVEEAAGYLDSAKEFLQSCSSDMPLTPSEKEVQS